MSDESPDPRHEQGRSGGAVLLIGGLLLALLLAVAVVGAAGFLFARKSAQAERMARDEAEYARAIAQASEAKAMTDETRAVMAAADERLAKDTASATVDQLQKNPFPVNLSTVTVREAEQLAGRRVRVNFDVIDVPDVQGDHVLYPADGTDDESERSVWVPAGRKVPLTGPAVGILHVIRHEPAVGADGTEFPEFVELRFIVER